MSVLVSLLITVLLPTNISAVADVIYIEPADSPFSDCPRQPCLTLDQYTQTTNLTTGNTLYFLPGNHTLQESVLNLKSVSNITLKGEVDVNIVCTSAVTIQCENVTGLKIQGLTFLLNFIDYEITALTLSKCHSVLILNTTFRGSADVNITRAMTLKHSTSTINSSVFEGNVGSAIYIQDDSSLTICGSSFTRNKGLGNGGAVYAQESTLLLDGSTPNHFTHNSDEQKGGAIQCKYNCSLEMKGINKFKDNYISSYESYDLYDLLVFYLAAGGAVFVTHGSLLLSGTVIFSNSTAVTGGAVYLKDCYVIVDGEVEFSGNTAQQSGGGMSAYQTSVTTTNKGHMKFIDNQAGYSGSALEIEGNRETRKSVLSANFLHNRVEGKAAVHLTSVQILFVNTNITGNINGAITTTDSDITFSGITRITENSYFNHVMNAISSNITFSGTTRITRNSGGGIIAHTSVLTFEKDTLFDNNSSLYIAKGGALYSQGGKVLFQGSTLFICNSADGYGGAFYGVGTSMYMQGVVNFTLNTASNGGAMYLDNEASLIFRPNSSLYTSYNTALKYGGGIYHVDNPTTHQCNKDTDLENLPPCFLQKELYAIKQNTVISFNDKAGIDGHFLYGGLMDRCKILTIYINDIQLYSTALYWFVPKVHTEGSTRIHRITSDPYKLCICTDGCSRSLSVQVYRGQKFTVSFLATAQMWATSTTVTAITSSRAKLEIYQTSQSLPDYCHPLPYTMYSRDSHEELVLYPDGPCRDTGDARVVIDVTYLALMDSFNLVNSALVRRDYNTIM